MPAVPAWKGGAYKGARPEGFQIPGFVTGGSDDERWKNYQIFLNQNPGARGNRLLHKQTGFNPAYGFTPPAAPDQPANPNMKHTAMPSQAGGMQNAATGTPQPGKPTPTGRWRGPNKGNPQGPGMQSVTGPGLQAPGVGGAPNLDAILQEILGQLGGGRNIGMPNDPLKQPQPIGPWQMQPGGPGPAIGGGDFQSILDELLRSILGPGRSPNAATGFGGGPGIPADMHSGPRRF